ncbi:hypothetical protein ACJX0J_016521 [Zea mays]
MLSDELLVNDAGIFPDQITAVPNTVTHTALAKARAALLMLKGKMKEATALGLVNKKNKIADLYHSPVVHLVVGNMCLYHFLPLIWHINLVETNVSCKRRFFSGSVFLFSTLLACRSLHLIMPLLAPDIYILLS